MKPLGKIKIKWSPEFAYAIGLLTTDGCLSRDGRHIDLTSKDAIQLKTFSACLGLTNKIGKRASTSSGKKKYSRIQFGDVNFYKFLLSIGLMPHKSKTLGEVKVPDSYFFDFLRGHFDGDGSFYSYWDPRWKSSFMFYTVFNSASKKHIMWLQVSLSKILKIKGHITKGRVKICYQLKYAKTGSLRLLHGLYDSPDSVCLLRKRLKINRALAIIGEKI